MNYWRVFLFIVGLAMFGSGAVLATGGSWMTVTGFVMALLMFLRVPEMIWEMYMNRNKNRIKGSTTITVIERDGTLLDAEDVFFVDGEYVVNWSEDE